MLLLVLPQSAFEAIVPVFIVIALVSIALQPQLDRLVAEHRPPPEAHGTGLPRVLVYLAGVYGGYFGAAQGILLLAILGLALPDDLQRVNALKNVLAGIVNGVAALVFIAVADVAWGPAALIAAGSVVGAQLAARYGRRLSAAGPAGGDRGGGNRRDRPAGDLETPEDLPCCEGRVREVGEHAVDPELVEGEVLLDRPARIAGRERVVAEGPRVDQKATRVRAGDQVGRREDGSAPAARDRDDVDLPRPDAVGVGLDLVEPRVRREAAERVGSSASDRPRPSSRRGGRTARA